MQELVKENKENKSLVLLGFLMISLAAFLIRLYGAIHINFIESEAAYVLGMGKTIPFTPSIIQNLVNNSMLNI